MPEPFDQPIPGLDGVDVGVHVAPICEGRVQACPRCSAPIVFAMAIDEGQLRTLQLVPVADPDGNVTLGTTIPGNLRAELISRDRPHGGDRFVIHHCPRADRPTTRRRAPNGPTARN